ncbi:MAG: M20/M25/M40 family metallo-hydrolase [Deltaproteobacteria bacterium]|nr:M20/M25/M40 family metallo-hydrolase [Deltaproteobacteria bacterium]MBI2532788.1 M20/M25/M40 family metallo-hydrolase [Deltaproteobacteria bacterium]
MEDAVLEQVDRNRIVELACNLADIVSITGEEEEVAKYLGGEFEKLGMEVEYQYVEDGRPNVIGRLKGTGGGATLMFNAHMDHFDNPQETVVEDDRIYGRGLVNMKAAFPCYIEAVAALQKAGVKLKGDLIIAGVVGEIEKAQVGRFQGKSYRGAGVGARYLMDHGVMADMCIIGEPTGLHLQIGNAGLIWARVSVDGRATKFVLAACKVAQAIQDWEREYQRKYPHKFMLPTVQIGAIDGGNAFKPGTRPTTDIFVIVKTLPGAVPLAIKRDLEAVCEKVKKRESDILDIRVDLYLSTDGYEISKSEYVVKAMASAHKMVFGKPVPYSKPIRYGITSDGSRIAAYGVPAITYGPGFGTHLVDPTETKAPAEWDAPSGVRRGVGIENMVNCTKVYATAALDICNRKKDEMAKK